MGSILIESDRKAVINKPNQRPYRPYGACEDVLYCKEPEVLLSGSAGTGKSCGVMAKLFFLAEKYDGCRILMVRKTRESMTQSVLVTWEDKVVPVGHSCLRGPNRNERKEYVFPNGSKVIVAGMRQSSRDNTQTIMSTEYDVAYVQEAIELTEDEWEKITTRLRNNKMPYQQIIGDTNPSSPIHWLKKRCDRGQCVMLHSVHEDNPVLYDRAAKQYTEFGKKYLEKLSNLTGARRERLFKGRWASAEGAVYENWNPLVHVIDRFEIPKSWRRFIAIDFGYVNAFVAQWYALDGDGRLYLYREYVKTKTLVEDHAKLIRCYCDGEPYVEAIICDHDAEGRATIEKYLERGTVAARKEISPGIQAVEARFRVLPDGKPRLMILRDSLIEVDQEMEDEKKPCGIVAELDGYCWNVKDPAKPKEEPIAINDHSCDPLRYMCAHLEEDFWVAPTELDTPTVVSEVPDKSPINWRSGDIDWRSGDIGWHNNKRI